MLLEPCRNISEYWQTAPRWREQSLKGRELTMWPEGPGRPWVPGVPGSPWKGHRITQLSMILRVTLTIIWGIGPVWIDLDCEVHCLPIFANILTSSPGLPAGPGGPEGPTSPWENKDKIEVRLHLFYWWKLKKKHKKQCKSIQCTLHTVSYQFP